jgi:regulatory protein
MNGGAKRFPESTTPWFWRTAGRPSFFGTSWPEGGTDSEAALKSHLVTSKVLRIQLMWRKKNRVRVHLEGTEPLEIALDVMERSGLHVGDDVTIQDLAQLQEDDTKWRVRHAALHLLSYTPRAEQELRRRLRSKNFPHALVESCLHLLEEQGLIDDHAFAAAYVRSRIRLKPTGRFRLTKELRQKGVSAEIAEEAIDQAFGNEETSERALACAAARRWLDRQGSSLIEGLAGADRSEERERARRRLHAFLSRRGFGADVIRVGMEEAEAGAREAAELGDALA